LEVGFRYYQRDTFFIWVFFFTLPFFFVFPLINYENYSESTSDGLPFRPIEDNPILNNSATNVSKPSVTWKDKLTRKQLVTATQQILETLSFNVSALASTQLPEDEDDDEAVVNALFHIPTSESSYDWESKAQVTRLAIPSFETWGDAQKKYTVRLKDSSFLLLLKKSFSFSFFFFSKN
jgi:hypothetical protein